MIGFFLSLPVKKINNNRFSSQNIVISSQNNVSNNIQDDLNKSYVSMDIENINKCQQKLPLFEPVLLLT